MQKQNAPTSVLTQLMLFEKQMSWRELPKETQERITNLFATMCAAIVRHQTEDTEEKTDE